MKLALAGIPILTAATILSVYLSKKKEYTAKKLGTKSKEELKNIYKILQKDLETCKDLLEETVRKGKLEQEARIIALENKRIKQIQKGGSFFENDLVPMILKKQEELGMCKKRIKYVVSEYDRIKKILRKI